ncbi:DUF5696 domain-containing protein [Paenibacillus eucommiae]|uniref:Uncharacterized protein n=1 Tax=Paenibacillus eucommiae TaxID=1355755 RepID=A0ABS4IPW0_9BACL|nr:DUF5696 domain-containing protein [Paenibacillus eucommiae]MBP1988649.1 hypothetical protein [Paenibacillus eucommiae]
MIKNRTVKMTKNTTMKMTTGSDDNGWIITSPELQVKVDRDTLVLEVEILPEVERQELEQEQEHKELKGRQKWRTVQGMDRITVRDGGQNRAISLAEAGLKHFSEYKSGYFQGVQIGLSQFPDSSGLGDLEIKLTVAIHPYTQELVCELYSFGRNKDEGAEERGAEARIEHIAWPAPFDFESSLAEDYTAIPAMQGYLVPANWEKPVFRYEEGSLQGRDAYMPWWGQVMDGGGYLAIVDTLWDARSSFEHIPSVHSRYGILWLPSLGEYNYTRRIRYCFQDEMNYVKMAKLYRDYVKRYGRFRSLREKIAQNPQVGRMIGAAVVHTMVHFYCVPESDFYDKENLANNDQRTPFADRAAQLERLNDRYDGSLYVHVDGWGRRGYDNLHPDILPPNPYCGGWEGFRQLRDTCSELGILLAVHDQYRDFYKDADSYDDRLAVQDEAGAIESCSIWPGGDHSFLCASVAKGYIERNYNQLQDEGIELDGAYLDVFAIVPLEECHNATHPMTRRECAEHRSACFQSIRSRGMIVSSEEPVDWAIPALDLVHHGPYALNPNPGRGPAIGLPVPLFSLVYHDAILLPWTLDTSGWGIPEGDWGFLHGLLNAGLPYLSIDPTDEEIVLVKQLAELHQRVGLLELVSHEFIDGHVRKQRAVYADGTRIEIDLDSNKYDIQYQV